MLEHLKAEPPDPVLSLIDMLRADKRPDKMDFGVGVYLDEHGRTPVMQAVKKAEKKLHEEQTSKSYVASAGDAVFTAGVRELVFGSALSATLGSRLMGLQATGGVAALRLGGDLLKRAEVSTIWLGKPTWPIHAPIMNAAGLAVKWFDYFDQATQTLQFDAMVEALSKAQAGEAVLVHASCHNPTGADPDAAQWRVLADLFVKRGLIPFVDMAYQGLGNGFEEDAAGLRIIAEAVPEAIFAISESKTFGLYRERTGALFFLAANEADAARTLSNALVAARVAYSMPPDHGAAIVRTILSDDGMRRSWTNELEAMRKRINGLRTTLADRAVAANLPLESVRNQRGMFSMLPLSREQVLELRSAHGVYMLENGRTNLCGLTPEKIDMLVERLGKVMKPA